MRVVRTRTGARILQGGLILSDVRAHPGPTHSLFDLLAGSIAALARGSRCALLGFAAGGVVAPLRAMGYAHPLRAVDLDLWAVPLFDELSRPWCGDVQVEQADAQEWLLRPGEPLDAVLEDLSAEIDGEVTKPPVSLGPLPEAIAGRLAPRGIVVTNVLPVPGWTWRRLLPHLAAPFAQAQVLELKNWENRVLIAGARLEPARSAAARLRRMLGAIGSREADAFRVRTLR